MPKTTAFFERLEPLNQTRIWKSWSGYLIAPSFRHSVISEYYSIRNSVSLLDSTPLFKYRFSGNDAGKLLEYALARDIRTCKPGRAQYTVWCNEAGFVLQDGVAIHAEKNEYWLTAAEPSLRYFQKLAEKLGLQRLQIEDISVDYGILALQGPHAHSVIKQLTDAATPLKYFRASKTKIAGADVLVSRTGYTGDLGYEIWVHSENAIAVWDAVYEAGQGYNLAPIGTTAMKMARVEAGLLLMDVDFQSAKYSWVDAQRETPCELGWNWMFRKLEQDDRDFVGRRAIEQEIAEERSRWTTVGLGIDWNHYREVHHRQGIAPPQHELYCEQTMSLYRRNDKPYDYAGYASSFLYSSLLKRPIAIAKVPLDLAQSGSEVEIELTVIRKPDYVLARVESLPFYDPPRKTADMRQEAK